MPSNDLIVLKNEGLYCPAGDFFIDPWRPVSRAVITHAHADHARAGHASYLAHKASEGILRTRIGESISLQTVEYGERVMMNGVSVSLHPAGHVLGSAQVRVEHDGRVWVASGDYKVAPDATCEAFEAVRCDTFITESTFGLPIYRWRDDREVFAEINQWWAENRDANRPTMLACYSFGKAQRILSGLDASIGAKSPTKTSLQKRSCSVRPAPARHRGRIDSRMQASALRAAGCSFAADGEWAVTTVDSCCPITPTGRGCKVQLRRLKRRV
jgi:putative mRNA 3-end processing factor